MTLELHDVPDVAIWMWAQEHEFTVVSKDADFAEISMERGFPPKLIWLRIDNWKTTDTHKPRPLSSFSSDPQRGYVRPRHCSSFRTPVIQIERRKIHVHTTTSSGCRKRALSSR